MMLRCCFVLLLGFWLSYAYGFELEGPKLRMDSVLRGYYMSYAAPLAPQVRPFITDDSRVVGYQLAQMETWTRVDRESGQQWLLGAYGPTDWLELTAGGVFGYERLPPEKNTAFSYALPLLQAKILFRKYAAGRGPGVGLVTGTFLPNGLRSFRPRGYGAFSFVTVTQCFGKEEQFLFHANTGLNYLFVQQENEWLHTWGFGTQIKTYRGFHLVGEIFSGDPYIPGTGTSYQVGFRHFFSDLLQIDGTVGKGISGDVVLPLWFSVGLRAVTTRFTKQK